VFSSQSPVDILYRKANKAFLYTKYTVCKGFTGLKHNISITMDQKLFRELETIRGREKRSTFIEHLIVLGLKDYAQSNQKKTVRTTDAAATLLPAPAAPNYTLEF
jgi:hypothetical protein